MQCIVGTVKRCPVCGPEPSVVVCDADGTTIRVRRDFLVAMRTPQERTPDGAPSVAGSKHADRVFIKTKETRGLLLLSVFSVSDEVLANLPMLDAAARPAAVAAPRRGGGRARGRGGRRRRARENPCCRWVFTLNNYTEGEAAAIKSLSTDVVKFLVVGREVGEQGTPHLQGILPRTSSATHAVLFPALSQQTGLQSFREKKHKEEFNIPSWEFEADFNPEVAAVNKREEYSWVNYEGQPWVDTNSPIF
uniref:CRESS-DNA virus Rep endonuclease domain-containing protein n=1 Tax=Branchiostoma floridae TaxID=7739 RepID=C3YY05_BRAFL|eukprot:XP_002598952.1 hypothetical protein BRAFLDRAFT_79884 [Branchiostoma floridae]